MPLASLPVQKQHGRRQPCGRHGDALGFMATVAILALAAPCEGVQDAHNYGAVQILCGVVQMIGEGVMQRTHRFRGVARPPSYKVNAVPIFNQDPQRKTIAYTSCALGCCSFLALDSRIAAFAASPITAAAASRAFESESAELEPSGTRHLWPCSVY